VFCPDVLPTDMAGEEVQWLPPELLFYWHPQRLWIIHT